MEAFVCLSAALEAFDEERATGLGDPVVLDEVDFVGLARADAERSQAAVKEVLARYYMTLRERQRALAADAWGSAMPEVAIMADLGEGVVVRRLTRRTTLAVVQLPGEAQRPWALLRWAHAPGDGDGAGAAGRE